MKNTTKKILGMLLAVVMLLSVCCVTAFADENNGSITVKNAVEGQTYDLYRLFDLESYNVQAEAYAYKITTKWAAFFKDAGSKYVTINEQGYVSANMGFDATTAANLAKEALAWAKANNIQPDVAPQTKEGNTVSFTELPLGYYLLDSSLGTLCSLTTTNPDQEVNDKNGKPTIDKEVQWNPGSNWGEWNDATIGDTINYQITVIGKEGAQNYIVHDTMEESLDMIFSSIKIVDREGEVSGDKYTVIQNPEDDCTFEIVFSEDFCNSIVNDQVITITYSAKLNDKAVVNPDSNDNEVFLSYGEKSRTETVTVKTYTYSAQIVKTTSDIAGKKVLTGAEFKLYYASGNGEKEIEVYKVREGVYRPVTDPQTQKAVNIEAGTPTIEGLDAGVYYLKEEVAPVGYNKLAGNSQFEITHNPNAEDGQGTNLIAVLTGSGDERVYLEGGVRVINQTGSEMPETGATGTIIFITIGAILVLGGYIFLVSKKRMDAEMNG